MSTVNSRRRYDSSGRRQQAERTKSAILTQARALFAERGYAATTVPQISRSAGVSPETVYKAFGPKAALVRALWEQGLAGTGPVPAERRSDELSAKGTDAVAIIRGWGEVMKEVAPLTASIVLLIRDAAAADSEMAALLAETDRQRRERMRHNARRLQRTGRLKAELGLARVTDVLWLYSSPELYELLVIKSNWSIEDFCRFAVAAMINSLLDT